MGDTLVENFQEGKMKLYSHTPEEVYAIEEATKKMVIIKSSTIDPNGIGYFASTLIPEGSLVISVVGEIIGHQTEQHSLQQTEEIHIEPGEWGGKYLNHSCEGNLFVRSDDRGIARFFAARDIIKGEELTYPYYLTELTWSPGVSELNITCNCGAKNCQGIIKSFDMLDYTQMKELVQTEKLSRYLIDWFHTRFR